MNSRFGTRPMVSTATKPAAPSPTAIGALGGSDITSIASTYGWSRSSLNMLPDTTRTVPGAPPPMVQISPLRGATAAPGVTTGSGDLALLG